MEITKAEFVISNTDIKKCPEPNIPEYAFIGRSNVGKSSLINMLTGHSKLAKISGTPGKTQLINHFIINDDWYLVDLPGYGYAKISKSMREKMEKFTKKYLATRENLMNVFVLIDCRHKPQQVDLDFMEWLGVNQIPFSIVFTKLDKLNVKESHRFLINYKKEMLKVWETMPPHFSTSAETSLGKDDVLRYIEEVNKLFAQ